ncbi:MAG: hypothetical protein HQ541_18865 [Mariniphaga sp.]|nr:hypothetical protein [Mariniphaga sp.]
MAKFPTFPTLYDDCKTLSISDLKRWNYLNPNQYKSGVIKWSSNGNETSSISVVVNTKNENPFLELNYKYGDESRCYKVILVTTLSNLGKGKVWYFLCPITKKRCHKLYLVGGYFLHRNAFNGCMYDSQIKSKKDRNMDKIFGAYFRIDKLYEQLYKKHFKKTYAGKPTKRYLKLIKQIQKAERLTLNDVKKLFNP